MNDVVHVVGVVGVVGQNFVERVFHAVDGVVALYAGCFFQIVLRQIGEEGTDFLCQLFFTADSEVGYTALGAVYGGTAQVFGRYVFTGDGLYYFRAGEEHVGYAFEHEYEVGDGRGVNGASGTRSADG